MADPSYSFNTCTVPHSLDNKIKIEDEPIFASFNFYGDYENSFKLKIKEEFSVPCCVFGTKDVLSPSTSLGKYPTISTELQKIIIKSFANQVATSADEFHKQRMKILKEEHDLKMKLLEAKQSHWWNMRNISSLVGTCSSHEQPQFIV